MIECVVRMEMPNGCYDCPFMDFQLCCCAKGRKYAGSSPVRPDWCPIICSLPDGHGRLVDADACAGVLRKLENEAVNPIEKICFGCAAKMFEEAFTIVPAERRENNADK